MAVFDYWLIDFAFQDEELPLAYTPEMGRKARKMFFKLIKKHKNEILDSESYIEMKESLNGFKTYNKYFTHFERVVKAFQENRAGRRDICRDVRSPYIKEEETDWFAEFVDNTIYGV